MGGAGQISWTRLESTYSALARWPGGQRLGGVGWLWWGDLQLQVAYAQRLLLLF